MERSDSNDESRSVALDEAMRALVGLFPWAHTYIEGKRTPLHGTGEFQRCAVARALIERHYGKAEAARLIGEHKPRLPRKPARPPLIP